MIHFQRESRRSTILPQELQLPNPETSVQGAVPAGEPGSAEGSAKTKEASTPAVAAKTDGAPPVDVGDKCVGPKVEITPPNPTPVAAAVALAGI